MVTGKKEGDYSVYCVEDNGIGISPEHHEKIFEIFHQLKPGIGGEGLGLSVVKKIIERHTGKIWVESEIDVGSKFFVSLPKA
jgi:signal transduction histidine kinase